MKLSTRGKYGVYAMIFLCQRAGEGPVPLKMFGDVGVPEAYLEQLLGALRRAGLVRTARGAQGGYELSRPAQEITARQILEALEGPVSFSDCVTSPDAVCLRSAACPARDVWASLTEEINSLLDKTTLAAMANGAGKAGDEKRKAAGGKTLQGEPSGA